LLDQISGETDVKKGAELMLEAENILIGEDNAIIPLYYRSRYVMMAPTVDDWTLTPLSTLYFKDAKEIAAE
jgi:ABC-type transport system substrate-binding protein